MEGEKDTKNNEFLLGASISSYQVEGGNVHADWHEAAEQGKVPTAGRASGYWEKFQEDHQIAKDIGLDALRVSIEWSRVEPEEGVYDEEAIEYYRRIIQDMKDKGLKIFVTLHHFTLPLWASRRGGFFSRRVQRSFKAFCKRMLSEFHEDVDFWATFNEPEVFSTLGYMLGMWPPFKRNPWLWWRMNSVLNRMHKRLYLVLKKKFPESKIGVVKNLAWYEPRRPGNILDKFISNLLLFIRYSSQIKSIRNHTDFLGVNFYFTHKMKFPFGGFDIKTEDEPKTEMDWPINSDGLYKVLKWASKAGLPMYVTENGLADKEDKYRRSYIQDHINAALKAKREGVDVRGYFYWSLLDNYEWADGFGPRFGLVEVDYDTLERRVRPSAEIIKSMKHEE